MWILKNYDELEKLNKTHKSVRGWPSVVGTMKKYCGKSISNEQMRYMESGKGSKRGDPVMEITSMSGLWYHPAMFYYVPEEGEEPDYEIY